MRGLGRITRRAAAAGLLALAALPVAAVANEVEPFRAHDFGGFRNVLAVGQGETVNAAELSDYETSGNPPRSFISQLPLYGGLLRAAPTLTPSGLDRYFKPATFGVPPGGRVGDAEHPRGGTTILRDRFNVPHVYGQSRADTEFGAGYATAEDRLFLMDVLRHMGRARLTELIGPGTNDSTVKGDAAQLKIADYSEAELQGMLDSAVASAGAEGHQILGDLNAYTAGINEYIREAREPPNDKLPAEYAALGKMPADWRPTDTVAVASLIGGIFGRGGGSEAQLSQVLTAARARFGQRAGTRIFRDFRAADDPEAPVTTDHRFPFDDPGRVNPQAVAIPDLGSIRDRNPIQSESTGPSAPTAKSRPTPSWLEQLQQRGLGLAHQMSNALLVTGQHSTTGHPLAVMGPQVGYYSPEILNELDLHGPGIDARGAAFPGVSLYVLLGRGPDYAWSATTATSDNSDEFVERLCEPGGGTPSLSSDHYLYRGRCIPFVTRDHVLRTGFNPTKPTDPPRTFHLKVERSVHGPIQARARVNGAPVAIALARSTYFHELDSAIAFKRLNDGEVTSARSFQRTMNRVNFAFNWFYADDRDVTYFTSGWYPLRHPGVNTSAPAWGTGEYDWRGFDPATFSSRRLAFFRHPRDLNPTRGYIVNWNNKQAPGWRAADDELDYGPVFRSQALTMRVRRAFRRSRTHRIGLTQLVQAMEDAGTVDIRAEQTYPELRAVIGRTKLPALREPLALLDAWVRRGAHRRDLDGDNVYDQSGAVALFDAWWPSLLRRSFGPVLGTRMMNALLELHGFGSPPPPGGSSFGSGWYGYLDKDLRMLLGRRVRGRFARVYCGGGLRLRCRQILLGALLDAADAVRARYGRGLSHVRVPATCPKGEPRHCDQIEFVTAGAVATSPIPFQNRPTFQQVVSVRGHRPRP